jgi:hypothetical protein
MPRVATQHVADQATRLQKAFLERFRLFQYVFHPCPNSAAWILPASRESMPLG